MPAICARLAMTMMSAAMMAQPREPAGLRAHRRA